MREAVKAALAILAAGAILWSVEPARAEAQDPSRPIITEGRSQADG